MPSCELCGKQTEVIQAIVEGSMVSVCRECSKFGKVIAIKNHDNYYHNQPRKRLILKKPEIVESIVKEYAQLINQAREKLKLKPKKFAKMMGLKESLLHKIESGHLKPPLDLAKKLEKFFKIKLIEMHEEGQKIQEVNLSKTTLTIGDLLKIKKHE